MIYAFDTYYTDHNARTVCIGFEQWTDSHYTSLYHQNTAISSEYVSGAFYKRELPCILNLLPQIGLQPADILLVDGYVILDNQGKHGLGGYLYTALNGQYPVIGVAKNDYISLKEQKQAVVRGDSHKPLFVTSLGMLPELAALNVRSMHGKYRIPTLLKIVDQLSREQDLVS